MIKRRLRIKQTDILEHRLATEAVQLRDQTRTMKQGKAREDALRKARQCETGARMSEWLRSPGLQPPK